MVHISGDAVLAAFAEVDRAIASEHSTDPLEAQPQTHNWEVWGLDRSERGIPVPNLNNVMLVWAKDPYFRGKVWYDEFLQRVMMEDYPGAIPREWTGADAVRTAIYFQRVIGITAMQTKIVKEAVMAVCAKDIRNCLKDWLDQLQWDGRPRIWNFFPEYCGAPNTAYTRAVSKNFFLTLIARAIRRGSKVDNVVVLEGEEGLKKSSMFECLGGDWFFTQHGDINQNQFFENLQGKWIVEIAEMDAFSRAETTRVYSVITTRSDRYRVPYEPYPADHPRSCVFVGTTNKDTWSNSETGGRRWWPIRCRGHIDVDAISRIREQLFAEAMHEFTREAKWWLMPEDETKIEQSARYQVDERNDMVEAWLLGKNRITVAEIMEECLKFDRSRIGSKAEQMSVGRMLAHLGWQKKIERNGDTTRRFWERGR